MTLKELKLVLNNADSSFDDYEVNGVSDIRVVDRNNFGRVDYPIDHVVVFEDEKSIALFNADDLVKWEVLVDEHNQDD